MSNAEGPIGSQQSNSEQSAPHKRQWNNSSALVVLYLLLGLTALGIPFYLTGFPRQLSRRWGLYLGIWLGEIIYLILGFFVNMQAQASESDGLVANPFRASNGFSRFLTVLQLILLPGQLIAIAIMNFISLISDH